MKPFQTWLKYFFSPTTKRMGKLKEKWKNWDGNGESSTIFSFFLSSALFLSNHFFLLLSQLTQSSMSNSFVHFYTKARANEISSNFVSDGSVKLEQLFFTRSFPRPHTKRVSPVSLIIYELIISFFIRLLFPIPRVRCLLKILMTMLPTCGDDNKNLY